MKALPLPLGYPAMEALLVETLPREPEWVYEPKWDGFRCLAFRNGPRVDLMSKAGKPLARYFPEVVAMLSELQPRQFVLDGELVIPEGKTLSFEQLLMRIHPAASRIARLSLEHPGRLIAFDLLVDARGRALVELPFRERRARLEAFFKQLGHGPEGLDLSPVTTSPARARRWLGSLAGGVDGIIAKRNDLPYQSGLRTGMQKVKQKRTADCVVGGFRFASTGKTVGSLLLGLYDANGLLHHVGFTSNLPTEERPAITARLRKLRKPPGFTGRAPGGPSRWSTRRSESWEPLAPRLVVEVEYDHVSGGRFRHGTSFLRWRPDKPPSRCTLEQIVGRSRA